MRHRFIITTIITLVAALILMALNQKSGAPNQTPNGFQRNFSSGRINFITQAAFNNFFSDVSEIKGDSVFFSGKVPGKIYISDLALKKLDTETWPIPFIPYLSPGFVTALNYPDISILGGNARCFITGNVKTKDYRIVKTVSTFSSAVSLNNATFIIRAIDTPGLDATFKKICPENGKVIAEKGIFPKLGDAGFSYDGKLNYDPITHLILYVCYNSNLFICFDTAFNILYRSHTIDTCFTPTIHIAHKVSSITVTAPPLTVNTKSCADNGILYIRSKLKSDNETNTAFKNNAVIDKYWISSGQYAGSFYIPLVNGQNLVKFKVAGNKLFVLYDNTISLYRIK